VTRPSFADRLPQNQARRRELIVAHEWLTDVFEKVIEIVPGDLRAKREPAQLFHEVLDYRWYQSQREYRAVPLDEATHGYVNDVLRALPDEAMSPDALAPIEARQLVNPYDPSQGFVDANEGERPYDPWEDDVADDDAAAPAGYLDVAALRARAKG
jgi:hypothetical protein